MVVFTCNNCGDSLQKPRVEKHYQTICKGPVSLTCVDCLKDFDMVKYVAHTKCVSEEERYSAKGTVQGGAKKGEKKQMGWVAMVTDIIEKETDLKPNEKKLLQFISKNENIPRKKAKFFNFIKSSTNNRTPEADIESVWAIMEKHKQSSNKENVKEDKTVEKEETPSTESKSKKKRKAVADDTETTMLDKASKKKKVEEVKTENELKVNSKRKASKEVENGYNTAANSEEPKKKKKKSGKNKSKADKLNGTDELGESKVEESTESTQEIITNGNVNKKHKKSKVEKIQESVESTQDIITNGNNNKKNKKSKVKPQDETKNGDPAINNNSTTLNGVKKVKSKKEKIEVTVDNTEIQEDQIKENKKQKLNKNNTQVDSIINGESNAEKTDTKFVWKDTIIDVLKKNSNSLVKDLLQKKVFQVYKNIIGTEPSEKQFKKKLSHVNNVKIENGSVILTE